MKMSKTKLIQIIKEELKEALEQVDYDNPHASWGANDQENLENISNTERSERDLMIANIYEMIDDIYGTKSLAQRYKFSEMSDEEVHALHKEWEAEYTDWHNEERVQDDLEDLYIQSEKELMSYIDLRKAEAEAEAQRQLMMTPEEGEELPRQAGMGKKITRRNTRNRMQEMIHKEMAHVLVEMFGGSMSLQKGDEYYHQRFPDLMNYGVTVQGEDGHTVLLQTMGNGFEPKIKPKQKFRMPKALFLRTFIEKSNEIDPDTGKRINIINLSEGLKHHIDTATPLTDNVYRVGSKKYFNIIKEAKTAYKKGIYKPLNEEEEQLLNSDLGEWAMFEGERVPLDFPMYTETLEEKKKKKKDPPIGKPMKGSGGKKYQVYVRNKKTGRIKKISYGDSKGGLKGNWNNAEARANFASRHNCAEKKDRTKAGYWACRAHKDFGTNVPGRFW